MKNKGIVVIVMILVVIASWGIVISSASSDKKDIEELKKQIELNKEVRTYKNILGIYEELIQIEPDNIEWYTGLAKAYYEMEQYGEYQKQNELIISKFPQDRIGYANLMNYYSNIKKDDEVIELYKNTPKKLKKDAEIKNLYKMSEWVYKYIGSSYKSIGDCIGNAYVIESNGVYGYKSKDISGEIVPKYDIARPFVEEYAAVNKYSEWYFIDAEGDRVLATKKKLKDLFSLSEGYAVAKLNGKYGYIDKNFNEYSFKYDYATSFYNGVAAVKKDGKWGLIDKDFKEIIPFKYDNVVRDEANICTRKGVIFFLKDGKYHMIGMDGKKIANKTFDDVKLFYSDYAAVKKGDKWGFIDTKGKTVIDFKYDDASGYSSGIAAVKLGDKWGCIDKNEKKILEFEYEEASITADNGVVVVKVGDSYRFIKFIKFD